VRIEDWVLVVKLVGWWGRVDVIARVNRVYECVGERSRSSRMAFFFHYTIDGTSYLVIVYSVCPTGALVRIFVISRYRGGGDWRRGSISESGRTDNILSWPRMCTLTIRIPLNISVVD
jgi:hypothetical protein